MKKVYQGEKWKRYSQKRSEALLKQKREEKQRQLARQKKDRNQRYQSEHRFYRSTRRLKKRVMVEAPSNFSIVNNADQMLTFFDKVDNYYFEYKQITFDLSGISELTEDAILYMLSRFHRFKHAYGYLRVFGNAPSDEECRRLLLDSGFYDYVTTRVPVTSVNRNMFSIKSGHLVSGEIAKQVIDFLRNCLGREFIRSKSTYPTLIECMANTRNHAYAKDDDPHLMWWLVALYKEDANCVHFTFLDNGLGIPSTIRKNFFEKLSEKFGEKIRNLLAATDSDLIRSALLGEFRTKTRFKWRGKGLPRIFSYVEKQEINNLKIISNTGSVSCAGGEIETKQLNKKFHGTLLSWDLV